MRLSAGWLEAELVRADRFVNVRWATVGALLRRPSIA